MEWYAATNRIRNVSIYCSWHNQVKKKRQGEEKRVSDASAKSDSVTINTYPRVLFSFSGRWHLHWHFEDTANGRCDNFIFVCMLSCFSRVWLFVIPWTVARHAPLSVGFSRQEYWSGCYSLLQRIFPAQGSNPGLPHCRQIPCCLSHQGMLVLKCVQRM